MASRRNRPRPRRRRGRFGFLYKLLSLLIIFTAVLIGCVVFFRVNQVTVTGNSRYTAEELIAASGVELGDNLLLVNKPQTARRITRQLPYVETVAPVRRLPDTLELRITETSAAVAVQTPDGWWLINAGGKLVELGDETLSQGLPRLLGLIPQGPILGSRMTVELADEPKLDGLKALLAALADRGMTEAVTDFIDLTATNVIRFSYGPDLTVVVPMSGDFDRRILSLQGVLDQFAARGEAVTGTLDLTYGDDQARLLPDRWLPDETGPVSDPTPQPFEPTVISPEPAETPPAG